MPETIRTIALPAYGSLDRFAPMAMPLPEPGNGEVRVRVQASALNPADYKVALGTVKFLHARNFPMVLGYDFSGVVDAVGADCAGFKPGDSVFGFLPYSPSNRRGAFAEALLARADGIALKPSGVPHAQAAAAATPGLTALQALRDVGRLPAAGGRVLVTGVSGGVGQMGVAIAQRLGATVEAVGSGRGLDIARSLGAARIVDRKAGRPSEVAQGPFDVVFDAAAAYRWRQWKGSIRDGGAYVCTLPSLAFVVDKLASVAAASRVGFVNVKSRPDDLQRLGAWLAGGLTVPVDSTIPVRDIGRGLAGFMQGGTVGRIVVDVAGGF
ncbi:MAG: NADP-dependent oxidoreductase, partial [Nevskia sp.]|nr:NADP-dependent oxidoreductase [Nevskia sp.]